MHQKTLVRTAVGANAIGALLLLGPLATVAAAQPVTTTTAPVTTTTVSPTTSVPPTTAPTTTTTLAPTTTTTTRPRRTTTTSSSTTTTTAAVSSTSSSATWGWVLLGVIVALAILLVLLLIARSRRVGRAAAWQHLVGPAVAAAELARDLVLSQTEADETQRRANVAVQVDEAVAGLERAAAAADDDTHRALCTRCAEGLRGLAFAVEADHLMRSGGEHPTGEQLAAADAARRNRAGELDAALRALSRETANNR